MKIQSYRTFTVSKCFLPAFKMLLVLDITTMKRNHTYDLLPTIRQNVLLSIFTFLSCCEIYRDLIVNGYYVEKHPLKRDACYCYKNLGQTNL